MTPDMVHGAVRVGLVVAALLVPPAQAALTQPPGGAAGESSRWSRVIDVAPPLAYGRGLGHAGPRDGSNRVRH
jgi:hypothetical protein